MKIGLAENRQAESAWTKSRGYALGRSRTFNLRIKSPLLCQLSYECNDDLIRKDRLGIRARWRHTARCETTCWNLRTRQLRVARQEGLEPPTHSLEGCRSIQLSYWRNGRTGALPAERH